MARKAIKKAKNIEFKRTVVLNNKSRKGTYLYVRKNGKSHYYKMIRSGKQKIEPQLKKGKTKATIRNVYTTSIKEENKALKELYEPIIKDKDLLAVLIQEENQSKIRNRLEQVITIKNEQGKTIARANQIGTTLREAIRRLKAEMKRGLNVRKDESPWLKEKLEQLAWKNVNIEGEGRITSIEIRSIFRKG